MAPERYNRSNFPNILNFHGTGTDPGVRQHKTGPYVNSWFQIVNDLDQKAASETTRFSECSLCRLNKHPETPLIKQVCGMVKHVEDTNYYWTLFGVGGEAGRAFLILSTSNKHNLDYFIWNKCHLPHFHQRWETLTPCSLVCVSHHAVRTTSNGYLED